MAGDGTRNPPKLMFAGSDRTGSGCNRRPFTLAGVVVWRGRFRRGFSLPAGVPGWPLRASWRRVSTAVCSGGVALDLGQEKAALERGQEGDGEGVRVDVVWELPSLVQAAQPVADGGLPLPESAGQQGSGVRVGLCELARE
jgi:hypothetical protein